MYTQLAQQPADGTYVDPNINSPKPDPLEYLLTASQRFAVQQLPVDFPAILSQAKLDWALLKAGLTSGAVTRDPDIASALEWFSDFPRYWETIRPNYLPDYSTTISAHQSALVSEADNFTAEVSGSPYTHGLAAGPLIIAGILVAAVAGVAGVIWAIGYVKKQSNVSAIIDGVVKGKLSPDVLKKALDEANSGSLFGNIGNITKWGAIGLIAWFALPTLVDAFKSRKAARA